MGAIITNIPVSSMDTSLEVFQELSPFGYLESRNSSGTYISRLLFNNVENKNISIAIFTNPEVLRPYNVNLNPYYLHGLLIMCSAPFSVDLVEERYNPSLSYNTSTLTCVNKPFIYDSHYYNAIPYVAGATVSTVFGSRTGIYTAETFDTIDAALLAGDISALSYPITYHYTNSTVSGPAEAAVGDTVTVSAVPNVGYGITDATTQILVTNNDVAVPYTWDAATNRITFTMPDPS